jgi:serine/threonine-protein kinase
MDDTPHARPSSLDANAALVGRTLAGKFRIESLVGSGAMGAVYKAHQIALDKTVAVKVLHGQFADDATFVRRFEREAKAATRVDHPNSMRVLDFGQEPDGLLYIAMEFLDGVDLFRVVREQWPLTAARIVDLLGQALAAIAVAHDLGIVHRDLKPENIMILRGIDDEGRPCDVVKVCDFGIATFTDGRRTLTVGAPKLTSQGLVVGTPEYMSPEQAKGEPLDTRSDLYAMGVILYQLLTGRLPFEADTALAILFKHATEEPVPPRRIQPDADERLEAICLKAMRKRREDRHQSARELRGELRAALAEGDTFGRASPVFAEAPAPQLAGPAAFGAAPTALLLQPAATPAAATPVSVPTQSKPTLDATVAASAAPPAPGGRRRGAIAGVLAVALGVAAVAIAGVAMRARMHPAAPVVRVPDVLFPAPSTALDPIPVLGLPAEVDKNAPLGASVRPPAPAAAAARPTSAKPGQPPLVDPTAAHVAPASTLSGEKPSTTGPADTPATAPAAAAIAPLAAADAPRPAAAVAPGLPAGAPYDASHARVEYSVTSAGGGAAARAVQRALGRAHSRWIQCYRGALERRGQGLDDQGSMHLAIDEVGNVVSARIVGLDAMPHVKQCISNASRVHVDGVDTGDAWADVSIALRAE